MANWCKYSAGSYPKYWCKVDNDYKSWSYVQNYCMNGGYKCSNYYISTATENILKNANVLKKEKNDSVIESIKFLRDEYLENNEEYKGLLEIYDYIGPAVASRMEEDNNKLVTASKVYSILNRISKLVEKEEIAKATRYYSQMVGVLIKKYDLGEFYEETNEKIELAEKTVKKHKIGPKTLD